MALITCRECKAQMSDQAAACPGCGFDYKGWKKKKTDERNGAIGLVALVIVGVVIWNPFGGSSSKATPQTAQAATVAQATEVPTRAATSTPAPVASPTPASIAPAIGQPVTEGNWQINFFTRPATWKQLGVSRYSKPTVAQGTFLVFQLEATNLHNVTSTLNTWDFKMTASDGRKFSTSSDGMIALIDYDAAKPLAMTDVQPGLKTRFSLVFDVDPSVTDYTLDFGKSRFAFTVR